MTDTFVVVCNLERRKHSVFIPTALQTLSVPSFLTLPYSSTAFHSTVCNSLPEEPSSVRGYLTQKQIRPGQACCESRPLGAALSQGLTDVTGPSVQHLCPQVQQARGIFPSTASQRSQGNEPWSHAVVLCSVMYWVWAPLPSLSQLPPPSEALPKTPSQKRLLALKSLSKICFWGS